jgi:hypothetical protein
MNWTFTTVRHWGESANGTWNLVVRDTVNGNVGNIEAAEVRVHGYETAQVVAATPPASQVVLENSPFTFTVVASGTPEFTYQWMKNGVPIPGATGASYTDPSASMEDAGTYTVLVSNGYSETTVGAFLGVLRPSEPTVVGPQGGCVTMTATAAGPGVAYQWKLNGVDLVNNANISGATTNQLTVCNLGPANDSSNAGDY